MDDFTAHGSGGGAGPMDDFTAHGSGGGTGPIATEPEVVLTGMTAAETAAAKNMEAQRTKSAIFFAI